MGYAKFGYKDLYFYKKDGKVIESKRTPALLDFYVADQLQRRGVGILLFHRILKEACINDPHRIAYDRPSPKLVSFLAKHFNLTGGDLQPNRFMVFEGMH